MRKKKNREFLWTPLDLAHGGQDIPPVVRRRMTSDAVERMKGFARERVATEKIKLHREAERHRRRLEKPLDSNNPDVARAIEGLRGVADRIAKRKVIAPAVTIPKAGILGGSYSVRLTPGYDYANVTSRLDAPGNSAFAHRSTGELGFNLLSEKPGEDEHGAYALASMGAVFIPMLGSGRLRASANPSLSYAWWTNANASTFAAMHLEISGYRRNGTFDPRASSGRPPGGLPPDGSTKLVWGNDTRIGLLEFDFASNPGNPLTVAVHVDTSHVYLVQLVCRGQALDYGKYERRPGGGFNVEDDYSLAGGILRATLPYIDLELRLDPELSRDL